MIVKTDGLCEPNPGGSACYGFVVYQKDRIIASGLGLVAQGKGATNNVGEYGAIIAALEWLLFNNYHRRKIKLLSDSQLCIRQLTGEYTVRSATLKDYFEKADGLIKKFPRLTLKWVSREDIAEADALSRVALNGVDARRQRAKRITKNNIKKTGEFTYLVRSQTDKDINYTVIAKNGRYSCSCPDFKNPCKHIMAVKMLAG